MDCGWTIPIEFDMVKKGKPGARWKSPGSSPRSLAAFLKRPQAGTNQRWVAV
jgi:hypothetical protein